MLAGILRGILSFTPSFSKSLTSSLSVGPANHFTVPPSRFLFLSHTHTDTARCPWSFMVEDRWCPALNHSILFSFFRSFFIRSGRGRPDPWESDLSVVNASVSGFEILMFASHFSTVKSSYKSVFNVHIDKNNHLCLF